MWGQCDSRVTCGSRLACPGQRPGGPVPHAQSALVGAIEEVTGSCHQPLNEVYAAVFIEAIVVKVRDGQVRAHCRHAGPT